MYVRKYEEGLEDTRGNRRKERMANIDSEEKRREIIIGRKGEKIISYVRI